MVWGLNENFWSSCILTLGVIPLALMLYDYCEQIHRTIFDNDLNNLRREANEKIIEQERIIDELTNSVKINRSEEKNS